MTRRISNIDAHCIQRLALVWSRIGIVTIVMPLNKPEQVIPASLRPDLPHSISGLGLKRFSNEQY